MEFFNKKQDVLDVQLTSYGKQLLSRGLFKPVYYAFSDDGVVYDSRWITGSNSDSQQSEIEERIQEETPRLKTQYRKVGAERAIFNSFDNSSAGLQTIQDTLEISSLYEGAAILDVANAKEDFAESEKLLADLLGTKSFLNNYNPAWNTIFYNGEISSSFPYYKKNDAFTFVPQLNCTLKDKAYRISEEYNPFKVITKAKNISSGLENYFSFNINGALDSFFSEFPVETTVANQIGEEVSIDADEGILFIEKDFLFISLEEANADYTTDNFSIEVYEVTTTSEESDGEEKLEKLVFLEETEGNLSAVYLNKAVENIFNIQVDEQIDKQLGCYLIGRDKNLKSQNIYISNIFDCEQPEGDSSISINPYTALPVANVEDVC